MNKLKKLKLLFSKTVHWFKERQYILIFLLLLLILLLHFAVTTYAPVPIYDENYYVSEARSILHERVIMYPEHPSLGKLFIAAGILVFGDNQWGWRIPSVIFGMVNAIIFYFICRRLAGKSAAFFAFFLFIFETLNFVFSGLAMLDVFSLTFMLLCFLFYLKKRYILSGSALALSGLCKFSGIFGVLAVLIHWFVVRKKQRPRDILFFLVSAFLILMIFMPIFDFAATGGWFNPIDRLTYMISAHQTVTIDTVNEAVSTSYPWEWILIPLRDQFTDWPNYSAIINITVWIMIIPSLGFIIYKFATTKSRVSLFALAWFIATYFVWILIVFAINRQTYLFYFFPTIGAICLAIGYMLHRLWVRSKAYTSVFGWLIRAGTIGYLAIHLFLFICLTPVPWALGLPE